MSKKIYKVGGYVRDKLLNLNPNDVDYVVVGATVREMLDEGFIQVGNDFPVFLHPETREEYALARTERKIGTGYNGFSCETKNVTLKDDLYRRDLTINAMAIDENGDIIDYFGGINDLKNNILRHVSEKFKEDPLRILRLGRFYAKFNKFKIADETLEFTKQMVKNGMLHNINNDRIGKELLKVLTLKYPSRFFYFLKEINSLSIFPEIELLDVNKKINKTMRISNKNDNIKSKFATLFITNEPTSNNLEDISNFCKRYNLPSELEKFAKKVLNNKNVAKFNDPMSITRLLRSFRVKQNTEDFTLFLKILNTISKDYNTEFLKKCMNKFIELKVTGNSKYEIDLQYADLFQELKKNHPFN